MGEVHPTIDYKSLNATKRPLRHGTYVCLVIAALTLLIPILVTFDGMGYRFDWHFYIKLGHFAGVSGPIVGLSIIFVALLNYFPKLDKQLLVLAGFLTSFAGFWADISMHG